MAFDLGGAREIQLQLLGGEVQNDQNDLFIRFADKGEIIFSRVVQRNILAFGQCRRIFAHLQQMLVVIQQGAWIMLLIPNVDSSFVIWIDRQPGFHVGGGKSRVGIVRPLHGRAVLVDRKSVV